MKTEDEEPSFQDLGLPLLRSRPGLALIPSDGVQLELNWVLRCVSAEALAPVVADSIGEDVTVPRECGCCDRAADLGVALEAVLGVLIPEVEGTVRASCAECAVLGVERDGVHRVNLCDVALRGVLLAVALEGEVEARDAVSEDRTVGSELTYLVSLSSTY